MKNETWEMSMLDWHQKGAFGVTLRPADVGNLIFSDNKVEARNAFFIVSEAVGENGWIYPCALAVVKTVLAALPNCSMAARAECLGLIALIAGSEPAPNSPYIVDDCLLEIRNSFWYFIYGLQFEDISFTSVYADILSCLGMEFGDLRSLIEKYLELALTRDLPKIDLDMIRNTIAALPR